MHYFFETLCRTTVCAAAVFLCSALLVGGANAQQPQGYAFVDVNLISMEDDRVRPNQTVLVRGDRIVEVGAADQLTVPDGFVRIDGAGSHYLVPGLAEMHGHVPDVNRSSERAVEETLFLYLANGITTVRGMLGWPGQLSLRERAQSGDLLSPNLYLAGPSFNGRSVNSPEEAVEKVRRQKQEGWDLLKVHPGLTLEEYDAMANTANELGIRFGGHVPEAVGLRHAIDMGQETFDHIDGYVEALNDGSGMLDESALSELVDETVEAGAWVVPTMVLWATLYGVNDLEDLVAFDELKYVPASSVASWKRQFEQRVNRSEYDAEQAQAVIDARMRILAALNDGGARILMGTDAPQQFSVPGFSLHREMQTMVEAGMSPYEVIRSGSVNVGEYFSSSDTFGKIRPGHRADMVLVRGNPLEDVARFADRVGVMVRGRWLDAATIDAKLAEIEARYRRGS